MTWKKRKQVILGGIAFISILFLFFIYWMRSNHQETTTTPAVIPTNNTPTTFTKIHMGNSYWTTLHSAAANPKATPKDLLRLVESVSRLLPCEECRTHFEQALRLHPFTRSKTRENVSIWFCELHNVVNQRLEKPQFDCDLEQLNKRWKLAGG